MFARTHIGSVRTRLTLCAVALASIGFVSTAHAFPGDPDLSLNWGERTFLPDAKGRISHAFIVPDTGQTLLVVASDTLRVERRLHGVELDATYGVSGRAALPAGTLLDAASDRTGRLVVMLERTTPEGQPAWVMARLDAHGRLDTSFGESGIAPFVLPKAYVDRMARVAQSGSRPRQIAMSDTGAVVVAGQRIGAWTDVKPWLVRFAPSGALDAATFGTGGIVELPMDSPLGSPPRKVTGTIVDVVALPGGAIVAATRTDFLIGETRVFRLDSSGRLDPSFGSGGMASTSAVDAAALAASPTGLVAVAGSAKTANESIVGRVVRFTSTGHPDPVFATNGVATITWDNTARQNGFEHIAFEGDGMNRIVLAGYTFARSKGKPGLSAQVHRFDANGALDRTFGANGSVELDFGYSSDLAYSLALGDSNFGYAITVAGSGDDRPALARIAGGRAGSYTNNLPLFIGNGASYSSRVAPGSLVSLFYPPITLPAGCVDFKSCDKLEFRIESDLPHRPLSVMTPVKPVFVSATQANLVLPEAIKGSKSAIAWIIDKSTNRGVGEKVFALGPVAPAIFTANASGTGTPSANLIRVINGQQKWENVTAQAIDLNGADEIYLILYGTGIRAASKVTATARYPAYYIDKGIPAEVTYAGSQGSFGGVDQINVRLPIAALKAAGARGTASIELEVSAPELGPATMRSNPVLISFTF